MRPSQKSPEIEKLLDKFSYLTNNGTRRTRTYSIKNNICLICGSPVQFRDKLSEKEYTISGMCQKCQDETFKLIED